MSAANIYFKAIYHKKYSESTKVVIRLKSSVYIIKTNILVLGVETSLLGTITTNYYWVI